MRTGLKLFGYVLLLALLFGFMAAPERTAQTIVSLGEVVATVADGVGIAVANIAENLPKN